MPDLSTASLIAVDWGTTSARAYRLDAAGRVLAEHATPLGIQQVRDGAFAAALDAMLGDWRNDAAPRLACGMIGSRQGWMEAPYCHCPVTFANLAGAITPVPGAGLAIVPGVTWRDSGDVPDVMRGEETKIVGVLAARAGRNSTRALIVLPGTHCKWAVVGGDALEAFATFMTGEVYAVLKAHSILGRMMAAEEADVPAPSAAFRKGFERGFGGDAGGSSLLHALFGTRTLALFGELAPAAAADYLSGLLIGAELRDGLAWAAQRDARAAPIVVVGAPALVQRYCAAFAIVGRSAEPGPPDAAARGLWELAREAGLVARSSNAAGMVP